MQARRLIEVNRQKNRSHASKGGFTMEYEVTIGLEIHSELKTDTKLFCGCRNDFGGEPNTRCCPVCLGLPGTLPVLNKKALELAIRAGLAMNCKISEFSKFDRKNYFYPDMPKAYQVTQYNLPICYDGYVDIETDNGIKRIGIERIHLEEDAGKLVHDAYADGSLIDYNRCGVPLIEIVTRPEINSAEEAKALFETIKSILEYTDVSDCKMQEGSLRADVNISVRPRGQEKLGVRTEIKNLNSIRAVYRAAQGEARRQIEVLSEGGIVCQETRRWDDKKGESMAMRNKEESMDYRYFPEPDLLPVIVDRDWIDSIRKSLPELPRARRDRYVNELGIPEYDAALITMNRKLADLFDRAAAVCGKPKLASNFIMTDIMRRINDQGEGILASSLNGDNLGEVLLFLDQGKITHASAAKVIDVIIETGEKPDNIIERLELWVQRDENLVNEIVKSVLEANRQALEDYLAGKEKAFGFLMGQVMSRLKGKGDPAQVRETLLREINKG